MLTERPARRADAGRDALPRRARSSRTTSAGSRSPQPAVHRRVMRAGRPGDGPRHRDRAEPRAARLARARWRPGSRTSSTTRPRPPSAPPRSSPRRSTSSASTLGRFVEAGIERDGRRAAASRCSARRSRGADAAHRARHARRRRRRGRAARAPRGARRRRGRGGSPSRWPRPGVDAGVARPASPRAAGPATDAALGWVAASLTARGLAEELQESTRADVRARRRRQDLRLHGPRRRWSRSTCTRGSRPRSPCSATSSSTRTIEVVRDYDRDAAEADRARLRAQPGVDEPARQRDRRARRDAARSRSRTRRDGACVAVDIADDGPGIPADDPRARLRPVLHDQGRRAGHRPRARHRAADRRRPPRRLADGRLATRAARPSTSGCRSHSVDASRRALIYLIAGPHGHRGSHGAGARARTRAVSSNGR